MTSTLNSLLALMDVRDEGDDVFVGPPSNGSSPRLFGGHVAGQAFAAAAKTVDREMLPDSLHSYFLRSGRADEPIRFGVRRTRDSRAFASRQVDAYQGSRLIFSMQASFHRAEAGLSHQYPPPVAPFPHTVPLLPSVMRSDPEEWPALYGEWGSVELRHVPVGEVAGESTSTGVSSHSQVWFRTEGRLPDDQALHCSVLTCITDLTLLSVAFVPHGVSHSHPGFLVASLDHSVWFHRPVRVDEWMLYDQLSPTAHGARGFCTGRIYSASGDHVASVCQEGLVRPLA